MTGLRRAAATSVTAGAALVALPGFCAAAVDVPRVEAEIVARTNAFRGAESRPPLEREPRLERAAKGFAEYIARTGRYGHEADGREPAERVAAAGYEYCTVAENLAYHYRSDGFATSAALGDAFVDGWKGSPEHRENMLLPDVMQTGVGVAQAEDGRYFGVQLFGRPKGAALRFDVENRSGAQAAYHAGGREYVLRPRERRTHVVCASVELSIARDGERFSRRIEDGGRYTVTDDGVVAR